MAETVKIPIFDGTDTASVVGIDTHDSVDDRIALVTADDDFADGVLGWQWLNYTTGGAANPVESGGVLSCDLPSAAGVRYTGYRALSTISGDFAVQVDFSNFSRVSGSAHARGRIYIDLSGLYVNLYRGLAASNEIVAETNFNGNSNVAYTNAGGTLYIERRNDVFLIFYKTPTGNKTLLKAFVGGPVTPALLYIIGEAGASTALNIDFDNFTITKSGWFPTSSPSPAQIWEGLPVGSIIDMSTIRIPEFADQSILYKLASNGGAQGSSLTQAQLRAESDITVTDATQSISVQPIIPWSSGNIRPEVAVNALVDVTFPSGGGKYDKFAIYGHRRIAA